MPATTDYPPGTDDHDIMQALYRLADEHGEVTTVVAPVAAEAGKRDAVVVRIVKAFIANGDVLLDKERNRLVLPGAVAAPVTVPAPRAEPSEVETPATAGREPEREVDYRMAVMDSPGLSTGARYTGVVIARHCWKTWELFAGSDTVAEWIGLKRTSHKTAGRYMDELAAAGFLVAFGKAGRATKYRLRLPA